MPRDVPTRRCGVTPRRAELRCVSDTDHPAARAVRAARAYSGKSRKQLADDVGVSAETIGRWERGEWRGDPPRGPMLESVARVSGILEFMQTIAGNDGDVDPARRFAAAARREAERRNGRPASVREVPPGAGAEGEAR